jgi:hypothetical protein
MSKKPDVFEDHTAPESSGIQGGEPDPTVNSSQPGEHPFKNKTKRRPPGFSGVPGAGSNPGKIDE